MSGSAFSAPRLLIRIFAVRVFPGRRNSTTSNVVPAHLPSWVASAGLPAAAAMEPGTGARVATGAAAAGGAAAAARGGAAGAGVGALSRVVQPAGGARPRVRGQGGRGIGLLRNVRGAGGRGGARPRTARPGGGK